METSKCGAGCLSSTDRLRIYRRCFHDLDEQLVQLQGEGYGPGDFELQMLQTEIQCLEELIMIFTDISSKVPSAGSKATAEEWCSESVEGLNLSLVTDILMLSATSPWTVYIAERSQWQICYVSPSAKRLLGWKTSELVGNAAWDGVHPEDVPILQRMLLFKEFSVGTGNSLAYRRARKDRTYATVNATGRAVGTRWYAWVEQQDAASSTSTPVGSLNSSNQTLQAGSRAEGELQLVNKVSGNVRARRVSSIKPSIDFDASKSGGSMPARPASPLASLPGLEKQSRQAKARVTIAEPEKVGVFEAGWEPNEPANEDLKGVVSVSAASESLGRLDERKDQGGVVPTRPKPPNAPSPSGSPQEELNVLSGKKILLVEDDRVNRTIAQKLLENLNCNVTVACNGKEALDILQSAPQPSAEQVAEGKEIPPQFDLVLMDLLMPVMDGTKAVLHFRDWEALQEPPRQRMTIFALTSNVSDGDMVKCAISGFDEFVSKPLTIDKLLERLAVRKS